MSNCMREHSRGWTPSRYDDYVEACAAASQDGLLLVPGIDYEDEDNVVHVAVWGRLPFFGPTPEIGRLLSKVAAADGHQRARSSLATAGVAAIRVAPGPST